MDYKKTGVFNTGFLIDWINEMMGDKKKEHSQCSLKIQKK